MSFIIVLYLLVTNLDKIICLYFIMFTPKRCYDWVV